MHGTASVGNSYFTSLGPSVRVQGSTRRSSESQVMQMPDRAMLLYKDLLIVSQTGDEDRIHLVPSLWIGGL